MAAELVFTNKGLSPERQSRGGEASQAEGTASAEAQRHKTADPLEELPGVQSVVGEQRR